MKLTHYSKKLIFYVYVFLSEVSIQVLLALAPGSTYFEVNPDIKPLLEDKAKSGIITSIGILEEYISTKTFFAGERLSVADISLYVTLNTVVGLTSLDFSKFPSVRRWFLTVGNVPKIAAVSPLPRTLSPIPVTVGGASCGGVPTSQILESGAILQGKWRRFRIRVKELFALGKEAIGKEVNVKGWIRTARSAERNQTLFVELTDGSIVKGLQLVLNVATTTGFQHIDAAGGTGASISVTGIVVSSPAKGQTIEVHVSSAEVIGPVYGGENGEVGGKYYPMGGKKAHSLEFLREKAHLRPRSKVFSSAMRMRHAMAFATHKFFNDRGFVYTHTPLITAADCEGAGEQVAHLTFLNGVSIVLVVQLFAVIFHRFILLRLFLIFDFLSEMMHAHLIFTSVYM